MSQVAPDVLLFLLRGTLMLTALCLLVEGLSHAAAGAGPRLHRLAWLVVLLAGVLPFRVPIRIPWHPAEGRPIERGQLESHHVESAAVNAAGMDLARRQPEPDSPVGPDAADWLLLAWLAGMGAFVAAGLGAYARFAWQCRATLPAGELFSGEWRQASLRLRVQQPPPLVVHEHLGPLLAALPGGCRIIVPREPWGNLSADGRLAVLRHELAHYHRRDIWKSLAVRLLALPHWFNPCAWWAARRYDECGEWACDAAAVAGQPALIPLYARTLLGLAVGRTLPSATSSAARGPTLSGRLRRLLSPERSMETSLMRKFLLFCAPLALAAVGLVRVELVAQEASADGEAPPATVEAVKAKAAALDKRLEDLGASLKEMKTRTDDMKSRVKTRMDALKVKADDPASFSAELKRRVALLESGDEANQLAAIKDAETLGDDGVMLLAASVKDSPHAAVRREALETAVSIGDSAYPAVAHGYATLPSDDRVFLAETLAASKLPDSLLLLAAMAGDKEADEALTTAVIKAAETVSDGPLLIAALGKEGDDKLIDRLLPVAASLKGDTGLTLLYGVAKQGKPQHKVAAVKAAVDRGPMGIVVLAAAFDCDDPDARTEVVRSARKIGGAVSQMIIDHALADENETLRQAAEKAAQE
jgi:beta-lactamase regulating signal transducer with metallopeptidase domain